MMPSTFRVAPHLSFLRGSLIAAAGLLSLSILLKAFFDLDRSWDTLWYHLPFAARLLSIVPDTSIQFSSSIEDRYLGFPLFAEYLQGLIWLVTKRPETTNLVAFFSLATYFLFLRLYFKVPLHLAALGLLAVPAVHIHASLSYVDLIGNLAVATLLMTLFATYISRRVPTFLDVSLASLAVAAAINTRFQLAPIAGLGLAILVLKLVWPSKTAAGVYIKSRGPQLLLLALALPIIFFTPLKNLWLHSNPFFPIKINVAGLELPGTATPGNFSPIPLLETPRSLRWFYSVLELSPGPFIQPKRSQIPLVQPVWSVDQWTDPHHPGYLMGGTFGAYMLFNLAFLSMLAWKIRSPEIRIGLVMLAMLSLVTSFFPESHIVRYYMYWPIILVSLNLALLQTSSVSKPSSRLISSNLFGTVALMAVLIVVMRTDGRYTLPKFSSFDDYVNQVVDKTLVAGLGPGDKLCFVGEAFEVKYFAYAPELRERGGYVIRTVYDKSECGDYRVVEKVAPKDSHN